MRPAIDALRRAALVAGDRLARPARRRPGRGTGRLGRDLHVGSPDGDPGTLAPADLRGLGRPGRLGGPHGADPDRADGRRQHVPQPRPHGQAGHHARPHQQRPGDPGDRRGLVRAGARGPWDRLWKRLRRAPRPARRVRDADPPPARRRDDRPRRPVLHVQGRGPCAAADPGPPADPDRRLGTEEDAANDRPLCRRLEHERHGRRVRRQGRHPGVPIAPISAGIPGRSSGRSASRSSSATTRPKRPGHWTPAWPTTASRRSPACPSCSVRRA